MNGPVLPEESPATQGGRRLGEGHAVAGQLVAPFDDNFVLAQDGLVVPGVGLAVRPVVQKGHGLAGEFLAVGHFQIVFQETFDLPATVAPSGSKAKGPLAAGFASDGFAGIRSC